jgi:hypothetical protein
MDLSYPFDDKDKVRISSQAKTMSSMAKAYDKLRVDYDKLRVDYDKLRVDYDKLVEAKTTKDEKNSDKTPCDHEMCVCGHELNHHWAVWKKSPYDDEKPLNPSYAREFTPMQCEECDCKKYEMETETKNSY